MQFFVTSISSIMGCNASASMSQERAELGFISEMDSEETAQVDLLAKTLCAQIIQVECQKLDGPVWAKKGVCQVSVPEMDEISKPEMDLEEVGEVDALAKSLCAQIIRSEGQILDHPCWAKNDQPVNALEAEQPDMRDAEVSCEASAVLLDEETKVATTVAFAQVNEVAANIPVEEEALCEPAPAVLNENEDGAYSNNDEPPTSSKDIRSFPSQASCPKCNGGGSRGLLGRRGFGLLSRQCRHCAAEQAAEQATVSQ